MGSLAKARKRAASKKEFKRKQSESRPQQGGRSISASRRKKQLVNKAKNANLDELVALSKAGANREIISRGLQQGIAQRQRSISQNSNNASRRNAAIQREIAKRQQQSEQLKFQLRQAQGSAGDLRTADPVSGSLAVTPGGNERVRRIAAKLGQNIREISQLRQQQQSPSDISNTRKEKNVFDIPQDSKKTVTPLGLLGFSTPSESAPADSPLQSTSNQKKDDPLRDAAEGFAAPFFNLGRLFANTPEAIRRDVEQFAKTGKTFELVNPFDPESRAKKKLTEGEKFFQKEALEKLQPTVVDSALTGKPTGRSKTFDTFSALGEAALIAAPFAAGKGTGAAASITSKIKPATKGPPVRPQTQAPTIESIAKGVVKQKSTAQKNNVPRNVFSQDKAEPSFVNTLISLGRGTTKTPEGGNFPTFTFGKPGGKGSGSKPRTFQDPKTRSGDKIVKGKDGLFQIQKTKTISDIVKQTTSKQKKKKSEFSQTLVNLGLGKVKTTKTKSQAALATEAFFKQQSKSAKKRQQDSLFGILIPRVDQNQPTKKLSVQSQPTKQQQRGTPAFLNFTPSQGTPQKQGFKNTPILKTTTTSTFAPVTTTKTTAIFNPIHNPPPPRGALIKGGFLFPFIGGGGSGGDPFGRGGRFRKNFLVSNLDPERAGVIAAADVPDLLKGSSERVFVAGDKALSKARKKQKVDDSIGGLLSNPLRGLDTPRKQSSPRKSKTGSKTKTKKSKTKKKKKR